MNSRSDFLHTDNMKKSLYLFTAISTVLATLIVALCVYCFSGCGAKKDETDTQSVEQPDDVAPAPDEDMHEYPERRDGMPEVIRNKNGIAVGYRGTFDGGEFFIIHFGSSDDCGDEDCSEGFERLIFGRSPVSHRLPRRHIPAPVEP